MAPQRKSTDYVLFIGNGVNRQDKDQHSWEHLVRGIADRAGAKHAADNLKEKPFSLVYEAICAESSRQKKEKLTEFEIKTIVGKQISNIEPNDLHEDMAELGIENIITTNYDYTLEKAFCGELGKRANSKRESMYSAHRARIAGSKKIWHIHGEASSPNTICLGHDHYSGYLAKIHDLISNWKGHDRETPIAKRLESREPVDSWWKLFVSRRVDILGFGFDYSEIDLWWLLGWRARKLLRSPGDTPKGSEIHYHVYEPQNGMGTKQRATCELLESFGVKINRLKGSNGHHAAYKKWITSYKALTSR